MVSATTNRLDYPDGYELTTQNMYCKWNRPSTFKQIIRIYLVKKKVMPWVIFYSCTII